MTSPGTGYGPLGGFMAGGYWAPVATGGVEYLCIQDLYCKVSSPQQFVFDGTTVSSELRFVQADLQAQASKGMAVLQDAAIGVSIPFSTENDGMARICMEYLKSLDAAVQASIEKSARHDGSAGLSVFFVKTPDGAASALTPYISSADGIAQVFEGVEYSIVLDAAAQVSAELLAHQDAIIQTATTVEEVMDGMAAVPNAVAIVQDGTAHIISIDFDIMPYVQLKSRGTVRAALKSRGTVRAALKSRGITIIRSK